MKSKSTGAKNKANASSSDKPAMPGAQSTRVLAIINENSTLSGVLSYLRKHDFQVKLAHTVADGVRELNNFKPEILLISWNLKNADIRKVHSVIIQKFSAICYILGEDDSTKTAAAMLSSGLPNTILYPVGGVNLYNRIQTALGRNTPKTTVQAPKKRSKSRDKTLLGGIEYKKPKKSEIPSETVWHIRVNSPNQANQIWESVIYKAGKPEYYYYKGEKPPDKWLTGTEEEAVNDHTYLFLTDAPATGDILTSFQDYSESTNFETEPEELEVREETDFNDDDDVSDGIFDASELAPREKIVPAKVPAPLTTSKSEISTLQVPPKQKVVPINQAPPPPEIIQPPSASVKSVPMVGSLTLLEKSVNSAIALAMKSEIQSFEAPILIDEISNLTVSVIKSSRFKGYLVSGQASDVSNPKFMKKVFDNLGQEMQKQNEALSTLCGVLEMKLDKLPFKKWTKEKAEFVIQSQIGNEEILFAFVPVEDLPQNFIDEDLVPVPIERFEEDKILYFDIFIHMPVNQKHILYLRNGAIFTKISKERLRGYNTKVLYVKKTDENLFFAYSARNVFEKTSISRSVPLPEIKRLA